MRKSIISTLASLSTNGKEITDAQMITWANNKVKAGGKSSKMQNFRDKSLGNGKFFLDLVDCLKPGYVDYSLVFEGKNEEECKSNGEFLVCFEREEVIHETFF